jgi:PAS domain S-box-containing protein
LSTDEKLTPAEPLLTSELASALESDRFRQFLDNVPFAVAVAELHPDERIVYVNLEFESLTGQSLAHLEGRPWSALPGQSEGPPLSEAIVEDQDYIGVFTFENDGETLTVDAWSNLIIDEDGEPVFRLISLATAVARLETDLSEFQQRIRDKDLQLRELQHRVANNLQLITALVRAEARNVEEHALTERFSRLAGRMEALGILYRALSAQNQPDTVDLGVYVSEVASAVMRAHAVEGIHLDLQVDTWPVSVNVAMPTGLAVNELLTNALKHAFQGREGGTITLRSLVDNDGCRVSVADDGVGLPKGVEWPQKGKLSSLIVQSLRQNARARVDLVSTPGKGVQVTIFFARDDAA